MPRRALKVCSVRGCPELTAAGRCDDHRAAAERHRGTAAQRGYGTRHSNRFRDGVLAKHPTCVCVDQHGAGHPEPCGARTVHADHWPRDRRQLIATGADPDDPRHGRGLCTSCHSWHTSQHQPGGWNAR